MGMWLNKIQSRRSSNERSIFVDSEQNGDVFFRFVRHYNKGLDVKHNDARLTKPQALKLAHWLLDHVAK